MNTRTGSHAGHTLEARLAATVAGGLTLRAETLPHDVTSRLRFARERALARAARARQPAAAVVAVAPGGVAALGRAFVPAWLRAVSVLPLLALVAGLVMIDHWTSREQVLATANFDTQLLADDLPPAAYTDPGFAEYLKSPSP